MKIVLLVVLSCLLWETQGYPYYPYYGANWDSLSYGSADNNRGGVVYSRYYNPYYMNRGAGAGMAAFMFRPEEQQQQQQVLPSQAAFSPYVPEKRPQNKPDISYLPPQQNEVYYPQPEIPQNPINEFTTEPTEKTEVISTTFRTVTPELIEPETEEIDEPAPKPKKRVLKKKPVKKPVEDEEDDVESEPRYPTGAFFPMYFGGRSSSAMGGATAIANAYSTGRGGVATSHATAYGPPRPDGKYYQQNRSV